MGFSHPLAFLVKVLSNDFCKAGFACNVQVSSLGCFDMQRSYSPSPALCPDASNTRQPPVLLPRCHKSSGRNEPGGSGAAGDEAMERRAVLPAPGAVRTGSKPGRHAPPICAMPRREMHEAFKASGCCLRGGPWHQCSLQTSFHNSIKDAEGGVRKEDRKPVCNLLFTLRKTMRRPEGRIQPS